MRPTNDKNHRKSHEDQAQSNQACTKNSNDPRAVDEQQLNSVSGGPKVMFTRDKPTGKRS